MNGQEIRERIDLNNRKIQTALNKFILTDEINRLMKEEKGKTKIQNQQIIS